MRAWLNNKYNHTFIFRFLKRHKLAMLLLVGVSLFAALLEGMSISLVFPIIEGISDTASNNVPFPFNNLVVLFAGMAMAQRLRIVAGAIFVMVILKGAFLYLSIVLAARLQLLAIKESRTECVNQLMKVGISYFHQKKNAYFQWIFTNHTETSVGATVNLIGAGLVKVFTILILAAFLLLLSWKLTLISSALILVSSSVMRFLARRVLDAGKKVNDTRHGFNDILFEIINGMKLIRQFSREGNFINKFHARVDEANRANYTATKISQSIAPVFETVGIGILSLILIGGSFIIPRDSVAWVGVLFTFIIVLNRMIVPVKTLNQTIATIIERVPTLRELDMFLSENGKDYQRGGSVQFRGLRSGIEFDNVAFGYGSSGSLVLKGVSLNIPKGSKVGIVGPSGAGKSTITELLMRFYDLRGGRILVDGVDLRDMALASWRGGIGIVAQDTFLFNDTIRANIGFARSGASDQEIVAAASKAHIHHFIKSLPEGYDAVIGERGVLLSGGQRQRLAIARAILVDPEILIFDEATSSLDTESEQIVQKALDDVSHGKTVITIAHRLSTVRNSDMIVVIDKGNVAEMGRHDELLKKSGLYSKLVEMQSLHV